MERSTSVAGAVPRLALALALGAGAGGCGGGMRDYVPAPGPYDELGAATRAALEHARELRAAGQLERAREILAPLQRVQPDKVPLGVELQEVELALLEAGRAVPGVEQDGERPPRQRLRAHYLREAEAAPDAASFVLAARLETDATAALRLLDRALEVDPRCIWAHYGRAHVLLEQEEFEASREALRRALGLDSGHLPTRRLEVRLLAEGGDVRGAANALALWLEKAEASLQVPSAELFDARVDLAILEALSGQPGQAQERLDGLLSGGPLDARALGARAAVLFTRGRFAAALRDVQTVQRLAPEDVLAATQRARIVEASGDLEEAVAAWSDVLAIFDRSETEEGAELGSLVMRIQAATRHQRLLQELRARQRRGGEP